MKAGDVLTCRWCGTELTVTGAQAKHGRPLPILCDGPRAGERHTIEEVGRTDGTQKGQRRV